MSANVPKYRTGEDVRVGDRIELDGNLGCVVFVIETGSFSPEFPATQWDYLEGGIMLKTEAHGLVLIESPDEDLILISRA